MNTSQEIMEAYNDAKANRYGKINYCLQAANQESVLEISTNIKT